MSRGLFRPSAVFWVDFLDPAKLDGFAPPSHFSLSGTKWPGNVATGFLSFRFSWNLASGKKKHSVLLVKRHAMCHAGSCDVDAFAFSDPFPFSGNLSSGFESNRIRVAVGIDFPNHRHPCQRPPPQQPVSPSPVTPVSAGFVCTPNFGRALGLPPTLSRKFGSSDQGRAWLEPAPRQSLGICFRLVSVFIW